MAAIDEMCVATVVVVWRQCGEEYKIHEGKLTGHYGDNLERYLTIIIVTVQIMHDIAHWEFKPEKTDTCMLVCTRPSHHSVF